MGVLMTWEGGGKRGWVFAGPGSAVAPTDRVRHPRSQGRGLVTEGLVSRAVGNLQRWGPQ